MRPYATVSAAGYQAKEVVDDGECSFASDIYAVGVSLVEVWAGEMWAGAETRGVGYPGVCLPHASASAPSILLHYLHHPPLRY